jgi:hypothetical protein
VPDVATAVTLITPFGTSSETEPAIGIYNLIPALTARENVALVTEIARAPMTPEVALDIVGLGARMDHFPSQPSGGEQQRVAIARAIAKRPMSRQARWTAGRSCACWRLSCGSMRSLQRQQPSSRTTLPSGKSRIAPSTSATVASRVSRPIRRARHRPRSHGDVMRTLDRKVLRDLRGTRAALSSWS